MVENSNDYLTCKGFIFDLDGTLVDSTKAVEKVWKMWCNENNLNFNEVLATSHGRPAIETIKAFIPNGPVEEMSQQFLQREIEETEELEQIKDANTFLAKIPPDNWSIATSGTDELATSRIKSANIQLPKHLITADDIEKGKPDPEIFYKAAERMNISIEKCVIFEDSLNGINAALSSGAKVIGLDTVYSRDDLQYTDLIISNFSEIDIKINYIDNRVEFFICKI